MTEPFDMALFLNVVLKGAHATRQRHFNQARIIQAAIQQHWQLGNPGTGKPNTYAGFSCATWNTTHRRAVITMA